MAPRPGRNRRPLPPHAHDPRYQARARQGRLVAVVIALTGVLWLVAQALIPQLGISPRHAVLVDLAALAAFIWSLIATWRIWRSKRPGE